jgi:hypothetical protein
MFSIIELEDGDHADINEIGWKCKQKLVQVGDG